MIGGSLDPPIITRTGFGARGGYPVGCEERLPTPNSVSQPPGGSSSLFVARDGAESPRPTHSVPRRRKCTQHHDHDLRRARRVRGPRRGPRRAEASPPRSRSRSCRSPTPWPAATCAARPRPARARPSPSACPIIERVGRAEPRRPKAIALVPTRELALQVHDELAPLAEQPRRAHGRHLRRRQHGAPDQDPGQGRRLRGRHPGPHDRPDRAQGGLGRRPRDRGARRGRPHGRHGVPAPGRVDPAPGRQPAPDPAVLGHPRRRRRHADQALPAGSGRCTRSSRAWSPSTR